MPIETVATLAAFGVAVLVAARREARRRQLLAVAVLALPVVLTLPDTLRSERREVRQGRGIDATTAEIAAPFIRGAVRRPGNVAAFRLFVQAREVVPGYTRIGTPSDLTQGWVRRAAWALAPRVIVAGTDNEWVLLRGTTPVEAGLEPRRAWRSGTLWLVQQ